MNKEILRLAIPNILSNISLPLLSTVDTALMGHLSIAHMGAVGLASMIFNFIYWNFGFLRMGTTGIVAQYHGAQETENSGAFLYGGLIVAIFIGLLLITISPVLLDLAISFLSVESEHVDFVSTYFNIRIWDAPASIGLYVFLGWFFGKQNAWIPLIVTIFINVINSFLSIYLVIGCNWGIEGVAIATVIAQYSGLFLIAAIYLLRFRINLSIKALIKYWNSSKLLRFFQVNRDLFIRTVCLTLSFGFLYRVSSEQGPTFLAVNVIILQILSWISYGIDGFAFAAESVVGKYYGAMNFKKLKQSVRLSFKWGFVVALFYSGVIFVFFDEILNIYTTDPEVLSVTAQFNMMIFLLPIISFSCYIWDGIFIGLTASRYMMKSMFLGLSFYLIFYELYLYQWTYGVWVSFCLFLMIRSFILYYYYNKYLSIKF